MIDSTSLTLKKSKETENLEGTCDLFGLCLCANEYCVTGARLDRDTGGLDLQQTTREERFQMVGSQRVCKQKRQGHSRAQRMDCDEQGYQRYFHIGKVKSTLGASRDFLQK